MKILKSSEYHEYIYSISKSVRIKQNSNDVLSKQIDFISNLFSRCNLCKEYLSLIVDNLKILTRCECVGIRVLQANGVIPYEAFTGFSYEFWEQENLLCMKTHQCVCIRVVNGMPEPLDRPILTANGSVWSNNLQEFGSRIPVEEYGRYRGNCIGHGFQTLAVIPIKSGGSVIGLIHIADTRINMLPLEAMALLESASSTIGTTIVRLINS